MYKKSRGGSLPRVSFEGNSRDGKRTMHLPTMKSDKSASKLVERMNQLLQLSSGGTVQRDLNLS